MNDGDVLVYLDAGCKINAFGKENYYRYIDYLNTKQDIICFEHQNCFEKQYSKTSLLSFFHFENNNDFIDSRQKIATVILIKKTKSSMDFVVEWFEIMHNNFSIIDDSPSALPEMPEFIAHRHDQSVFSALCYKYGIKGLSQYEVYPNGGDWGQMVDYPFWAARRKVYKQDSRFVRIIRRISNLLHL